MRESRIGQYLPAIAEVFARHAAAAMILWFDHEKASNDEINAGKSERCREQANATWVRAILTDSQRVMREALESRELQNIVSAMEDSAVEPGR